MLGFRLRNQLRFCFTVDMPTEPGVSVVGDAGAESVKDEFRDLRERKRRTLPGRVDVGEPGGPCSLSFCWERAVPCGCWFSFCEAGAVVVAVVVGALGFSSMGESGGGGMSVPAVRDPRGPREGRLNLPFIGMVGLEEVCAIFYVNGVLT